jgi:LytR cell envelope-related transcriptional attenuator
LGEHGGIARERAAWQVSTPFPPGDPGEPGGPGLPPRAARTAQPIRAVLLVVIVVAIGVLVLARMSTPHNTAAAATGSSTTTATTTKGAGTTTTSTTTTTVATSSTTTTTVPPSSVTVLVLNGTTTPHAALYFQTKLSKQGYDTLAPNNAATDTVKLSEIVIAKGTAKSTNAYQVAGIVGVGPSQVVEPSASNDSAIPPSMLQSADLIVLVGSDISHQVPAGYSG